MRHCEFCATELPDDAIFCWHCGRAPTHSTEALTSASGFPAFDSHIEDVATAPNIPTPSLSVPTDEAGEDEDENTVASISETPTLPHPLPVQENPASNISDQDDSEEEEEKRRSAALLGLGLSLATQASGGDVPMVQGTPQISGVPSVQGTPSIPKIPHMPNVPKWQISRLPTYPNIPAIQQAAPAQHGTHLAQTSHPPQPTQPRTGSPRPGPRSGGCIPALLVAVVASVLILTSIIGAGFTILKPVLSLSGSTNVVWGGSIHLYGSNFIPASSVILTLDGTGPLYYASQSPAIWLSHSTITTAGIAMIAEQFGRSNSLKNSIVVGADGTFNVIVTVNPKWHAGQHTIRASEQISQRSAELSFTILQQGETPAATLTVTFMVQSWCISVTPRAFKLSSAIGNNSSQTQTVTVSNCSSAEGNWFASTNANWLKIIPTSGILSQVPPVKTWGHVGPDLSRTPRRSLSFLPAMNDGASRKERV